MPKAIFLKKKDHIPGEYCLISYEKFIENDYNNNRVIKLKCGHRFKYQNIIESYKITNCSGRNYIGKRICPYCRKSGGYIPYNGLQAIRGIHNLNAVKEWRLKMLEDKKKQNGCNTCSAILKTGINRGQECGSLVKNNNSPYIFITTIHENENNILNITFKKLKWCGKHKKNKERFQKSNIDIELISFIGKFLPKMILSFRPDYFRLLLLNISDTEYHVYISPKNIFIILEKLSIKLSTQEDVVSLKKYFNQHITIDTCNNKLDFKQQVCVV